MKVKHLILGLFTGITIALVTCSPSVKTQTKQYSPSDTLHQAFKRTNVFPDSFKVEVTRDSSVSASYADSFLISSMIHNIYKMDTLIDNSLYLNAEWTQLAYKFATIGYKNKYYEFIMKADSFMHEANAQEAAQDKMCAILDSFKTNKCGDAPRLIGYTVKRDSTVLMKGTTILTQDYRLNPMSNEYR